MQDFRASNSTPPPDLPERFLAEVLRHHPEWGPHLVPQGDWSGAEELRWVLPAKERGDIVQIVYDLTNPGTIHVTWATGHERLGFDWHVEPTVETVTRRAVKEAERRIRGVGVPRKSIRKLRP